MSQSTKNFLLSGKDGGVSYRYLNSSTSQETSSVFILEELLLHSYITCQTHQTGYGQCSYLRLVDENGRIHCSLVLGKARVAPLRSVTISRLELTAATVSVRVANRLKEELNYEELQDLY